MWWRNAKTRKHLKGVLRVATYFALLELVVGAVYLRNARAEVKSHTVEIGRRMFALANATQQDVSKATLNGQTMWVGSSLSDDTVKSILERYEAHCKSQASQPAESWAMLAGQEPGESTGVLADLGIVRGGNDDEGTVVCFTRGEQSKASVADAFNAFAETGELGAIGNLRYVYARKARDGQSVLLTAWTDRAFNLAKLAPPAGGDAPGIDFPEIPRPPDSTRFFGAAIEDTPYALNIYRTKALPSSVIEFYNRHLGESGWHAVDPDAEAFMSDDMKQKGALMRLYSKGSIVLTLSAHSDDGDTLAGLAIAGFDGRD